MQAIAIIAKFEIQVGDQSDLSGDEELDLLNIKYQDICSERPWEFLKKSKTGNITVTGGVATIPIPDDFRQFAENNTLTDIASRIENNAAPRVIFVGGSYKPYQIVNWSDRRQYRGSSGFAYLDRPNNCITFTDIPPELTYEFDYIRTPPNLQLTDEPIFPAEYHPAIYYLMSVDSTIIELFDKARSYAGENQALAESRLKSMRYWNAQQLNN